MWIIPNNLTVSPSVRATLESSWDLKELSRILEPSVMWRSKPSLARTWLQRLNRVSWLKHLSGRILKPSMENRFATEYTSSLAVIPASPSQSRDSEKEQTTPDTFGRILNESFRQLNLFGASLRTLEDTLVLDSPKFIEAYGLWVITLRQDCLQRQRSARHTRENGCLSWPTSQARDWKGKQGQAYLEKAYDLPALVEQQVNWPTPNIPNRGREISKKHRPESGGIDLQSSVGPPAPNSPSTIGKSQESLWRTPSANEAGAKVETLYTKDGKPARPGERAYRRTPSGELVLQSQTINQQVEMVQAKGKLNSAWVCILMGLPSFWTKLIDFSDDTPYTMVDLTERDNYEISYKILCLLSEEVGTQTIQWEVGRFFYFYTQEVLRQGLLRKRSDKRGSGEECVTQEGKQVSWQELREMWNEEGIGNPSHRQGHQEQQEKQPNNSLCEVPHQMALGEWEVYAQKIKANLLSMWETMPYTSWDVRDSLSKSKKIWESASDEETYKWYLGCCKRYIHWQESQQKTSTRRDELRLLGNGVIPAQAELAFKVLYEKQIQTKKS